MRHIMSYIMLTIFSITMVSALPSIAAAQTEGIAAVVNDGAVSESDVKARNRIGAAIRSRQANDRFVPHSRH